MRDDELSLPSAPEIIDVFDDPELLGLEPRPQGYGCSSTPKTRARYAFLSGKREGDFWQEGNILYRKGPRGIEAEAQQQAQWNEWASEQDCKFMQSRPELKDPAVYQKLQKTAVEYLRSTGMTDQQIAQAWNTPHVRSAEAQQIIADAASAWAAREAIKNGKGRKPVPPVQKPGSAADRMSVSDVAIKAAEAAVAANPSVRNVAKLREVLG